MLATGKETLQIKEKIHNGRYVSIAMGRALSLLSKDVMWRLVMTIRYLKNELLV